MSKAAQVRQFAEANGYSVVEVHLPKSPWSANVKGFPRVDAKALIAIAMRRQAAELLLQESEE